MTKALEKRLEADLGAKIRCSHPLSGGDINQAFAVELEDGRSIFVKTHPSAPSDMFEAEARGLRWLARADALPVPAVVAFADHDSPPPRYLALELVSPSSRRDDFDERLGRGLALLHRHGADRFGLDYDNYIGPLPQRNAEAPDWATFYRDRRIAPQIERASSAGFIDARLRSALDRLMDRMESLVGPSEPPARLHGDLWSGNVHCTSEGDPCLIDPAVYGGHREMDLAMLRLFGSPSSRFFAAYEEVYPLDAGHEARVPLHQLYPLLVHVNLFGSGYVASVRRAVDAMLL